MIWVVGNTGPGPTRPALPAHARASILLLLLLLLLPLMLTVHAQSTPPPDEDPGPSNHTAHSLLGNAKDSMPASDPTGSTRPDPSAAHPPSAQTTQEPAEATSVHCLPVEHVAAVHSQRPSTARSSDAHATPPSQLHTQSSSVTADPVRDRQTRRRSTLEVIPVLFASAQTPPTLNFDLAFAV